MLVALTVDQKAIRGLAFAGPRDLPGFQARFPDCDVYQAAPEDVGHTWELAAPAARRPTAPWPPERFTPSRRLWRAMIANVLSD